MDFWGNEESGQVYVPVYAEDMGVVSLMSAEGSYGEGVLKGFVVKWHSDGGITGQFGWEINGKHIEHVPGDKDKTNQNVANAVTSTEDLDYIVINMHDSGCYDYHR